MYALDMRAVTPYRFGSARASRCAMPSHTKTRLVCSAAAHKQAHAYNSLENEIAALEAQYTPTAGGSSTTADDESSLASTTTAPDDELKR